MFCWVSYSVETEAISTFSQWINFLLIPLGDQRLEKLNLRERYPGPDKFLVSTLNLFLGQKKIILMRMKLLFS